MGAYQIAFVHEDREYMERMCLLLRSILPLLPDVRAYTTGQAFLQELSEGRNYDMVLLGAEMLPLLEQKIASDQRCVWVQLEDEESGDLETSEAEALRRGVWHVGKYQESRKFLDGIGAILAAGTEGSSSADKENAHLVTVFSAAGGSGCSLISYSLGQCFAGMGFRVFYLSLDSAQTGYGIRRTVSGEEGYERIGYNLKFRRPLTWSRLERDLEELPSGCTGGSRSMNAGKDGSMNAGRGGSMKRLPSARNFHSQFEMDRGDFSKLIWLAKHAKNLDFIVADIGCRWDERGLLLLETAGTGILIQTEDPSHRMRIRSLEREIERIMEPKQQPGGNGFRLFRILNHPFPGRTAKNREPGEAKIQHDFKVPHLNDIWKEGVVQEEWIPFNPDSGIHEMLKPLTWNIVHLREKQEGS